MFAVVLLTPDLTPYRWFRLNLTHLGNINPSKGFRTNFLFAFATVKSPAAGTEPEGVSILFDVFSEITLSLARSDT